jgi:hypothetical protein
VFFLFVPGVNGLEKFQTDDEHGRSETAQGNPPRLLSASAFIFHDANLRERTLSEDEAGKIFEIIFRPELTWRRAANTFHP